MQARLFFARLMPSTCQTEIDNGIHMMKIILFGKTAPGWSVFGHVVKN